MAFNNDGYLYFGLSIAKAAALIMIMMVNILRATPPRDLQMNWNEKMLFLNLNIKWSTMHGWLEWISETLLLRIYLQ